MKISKSTVKSVLTSTLGIIVLSFLVLGLSQATLAQTAPGVPPEAGIPGVQNQPNVNTVNDLLVIVRNIVRIIYIIFFILAVVFIIVAAFVYLTSAGKPENTKKARDMIIYAAIAIAVALLAVSVQFIVSNFLQSRGAI